jgi:mono/diheme cytochrome c family protein
MRTALIFAILGLGLWTGLISPVRAVDLENDGQAVITFLKQHCVKCHRAAKHEGDVRLDDLAAGNSLQTDRWLAVRDQLRDGLMPPEKEPRPDPVQMRMVVAFASAKSGGHAARLPNQGNLVPHELLFGKPVGTDDASRGATGARVWRLSPDGYKAFVRDVHRGRADGIVQPFTLIPDRGIKDFAGLYSIDESSTEILLRNAQVIVEGQTAHEVKDGKLNGKNDTVGEFVKLMDPALVPTRLQLESAIQTQFRLAIGRKPDADETGRFLALYDRCLKQADSPSAVKVMLQAVLLRTDAMYRSELGTGDADTAGRRMLAPLEIVRAVSLALTDRRDGTLFNAADNGQLTTRGQVAEHVRRILDDPKLDKPGLVRFFREYFEYHRATDVFKDRPTDKIKHQPAILVGDTDRLVLHILQADKQVLRELLTTTRSFVNSNMKVDKSTPDRRLVLVPNDVLPKPDPKRPPEWIGTVDQVYGFDEWPKDQPAELPADTRIGILMQPSWLVAFSTNFENDPVRRGRWIRERLLGGTVPDLPIGVVAQVPDEKDRTYRDRLTVTREAKCWKCHQRMDDLGLSFENFDHYGRFRTVEPVVDLEATGKNVDTKGKSLGVIHRDESLDTTGLIADSGDPKLDGPVHDPREMLRRLAESDRVRQVFVRHAFRYFLGRNETLSDAATLQSADTAYVESGGSFKALVVSLLTSDPFLLRGETK